MDLFADDEGSGVSKWRYRKDNGDWSDWKDYPPMSDETFIELDSVHGEHVIWVQYLDKAGNIQEYSDSIFLDLLRSMEEVSFRVKDDIYSEMDVYYLPSSRAFFREVFDVLIQEGSGDYRVEFEAMNARTGERQLLSMKFPLQSNESMIYRYSGGKPVCKNIYDGDKVIVKGRVRDERTGKTSGWSSGAIFCIDDTGPEGSMAINGGDEKTLEDGVELDLFASDEGAGVAAWRYKVDDGEWCEWKIYPSSKPERVIRLAKDKGVHTVFVEFKDSVGNVESLSDSIVRE
jgi:hypothetical protein